MVSLLSCTALQTQYLGTTMYFPNPDQRTSSAAKA